MYGNGPHHGAPGYGVPPNMGAYYQDQAPKIQGQGPRGRDWGPSISRGRGSFIDNVDNWRQGQYGEGEYPSPSYFHPESSSGWEYNVPTSNAFFPLRDKDGPEGYQAPDPPHYPTPSGGAWFATPPFQPHGGSNTPGTMLAPNDSSDWGFHRPSQGIKRQGERGEGIEGEAMQGTETAQKRKGPRYFQPEL